MWDTPPSPRDAGFDRSCHIILRRKEPDLYQSLVPVTYTWVNRTQSSRSDHPPPYTEEAYCQKRRVNAGKWWHHGPHSEEHRSAERAAPAAGAAWGGDVA